MHAFDEHVGRDDAAASARGLPERGIVADAEEYSCAATRSPSRSSKGRNRRDDLVFGHARSERTRRSASRRIRRPEDCRAHYERVGAGIDERARILFADAAIHLDEAAGLRPSMSARASRTFSKDRAMNF